MYAMGFASQSIQTNAKLVHNGCYDSLGVFFNAPEKLQNHKIHMDVNFHFLCLFLMCSRKSSRIRSIFHTGDISGGFTGVGLDGGCGCSGMVNR